MSIESVPTSNALQMIRDMQREICDLESKCEHAEQDAKELNDVVEGLRDIEEKYNDAQTSVRLIGIELQKTNEERDRWSARASQLEHDNSVLRSQIRSETNIITAFLRDALANSSLLESPEIRKLQIIFGNWAGQPSPEETIEPLRELDPTIAKHFLVDLWEALDSKRNEERKS